ncbi:MAG: hypothetical protein K9H25_19150 [Rhodospirillum sp.]|nr:hypothetical protein [Rhodospirillum sp.]MCF8491225.1 hypothetical protein [Rhodospirillum sp.]MCF8500869.1 hypothetical protein [Rhodospirillum sp.]
MSGPTQKDYERLFALYGDAVDTAYRDMPEGEAGHFDLLFEQLMTLLAKGSAFNATIHRDFTSAAELYKIGDPLILKRLTDPDNRLFVLSDFKDYLFLTRKLSRAG